MAKKHFLAATTSVGTAFSGRGVSGSVWSSNANSYFLYYVGDNAANKNNYTGGLLATASLIQSVETDDGPESIWVLAPFREQAGNYTVKAWKFSDEADFVTNFAKIPGDAGQMPLAGINTSSATLNILAEYLAETGSAIVMLGNGDFPYPEGSWPL
jgi:hypothetical protein